MKSALLWIGSILLVVFAFLMMVKDAGEKGYSRGYAAAEIKFKDDQIEQLGSLIRSARDLTHEANKASQALGKTVSDRKLADAKTTKDIRDALAATSSSRFGCLFDAGVMQQLSTARERAAEAATSGVRSSMPSPR